MRYDISRSRGKKQWYDTNNITSALGTTCSIRISRKVSTSFPLTTHVVGVSWADIVEDEEPEEVESTEQKKEQQPEDKEGQKTKVPAGPAAAPAGKKKK